MFRWEMKKLSGIKEIRARLLHIIVYTIRINKYYGYLNSDTYTTKKPTLKRLIFTIRSVFDVTLIKNNLKEMAKANSEVQMAKYDLILFIRNNFDTGVKLFSDRDENLIYALNQVTIEGEYCEFGVYKGESLKTIASSTNRQVHGFDSFIGLPEDWRKGLPKGTFKLTEYEFSKLEMPPNVILHVGWFKETIPLYKEKIGDLPLAFIHIDSDLYSSAELIFDFLNKNIVKGTVIVFDEYLGYPGWQNGEYKAFVEFSKKYKKNFEYLSCNVLGEQVSFIVS